MTDWDPRDKKKPLGYNRSLALVSAIEETRTGKTPTALLTKLKAAADYDDFCAGCEPHGIFSNIHTLEVDLFEESEKYREAIIETLREGPFGAERKGWIDEWEAHPDELDIDKFLALVDQIGKGRFAQRLGARIAELNPPTYIAKAIKYVADRV